jgi:hypothetical protein
MGRWLTDQRATQLALRAPDSSTPRFAREEHTREEPREITREEPREITREEPRGITREEPRGTVEEARNRKGRRAKVERIWYGAA